MIELTKDPIHHADKNGEHFYGENFIYEYPSKRHIKSKSGLNHGSSLMEVDWGGKLRVNHIHECMPSEVHWGDHDPSLYPMDEYSISEVDWEPMIQVTFFTLCTLILMQAKRFLHPRVVGRSITKDIFHPSHRLESCGRELVHHLALQKGPNRLDHQLDQQWDPSQILDPLLSSSDPDLCPSPCLSLTNTVLLVGHSYYLLKTMGRDLTSTSLMVYLKYSFDIEDGFSNSKSSKQYGSSLTLKVVTIYLPNGIWGRNFCNLHSSGKP